MSTGYETGLARPLFVCLCAKRFSFGAGDQSEGTIERSLRAVSRGSGAVDSVATDGAGVRRGGLLVVGESDHRTRVIDRLLVVVASLLGAVETFLADVSRLLLAIDSALAIVERPRSDVLSDRSVVTIVIVGALFLIDA